MDTVTVKVSLSFDAPLGHQQVQQLQDKFFELLDSEINDGSLALDDAEVIDFEVELERSDE